MKVTYYHARMDYRDEVKASITVEDETTNLAETLEQIRFEIAKSFWSDPEELEEKISDLRSEAIRLEGQINKYASDLKELKRVANQNVELLEKAGIDASDIILPF